MINCINMNALHNEIELHHTLFISSNCKNFNLNAPIWTLWNTEWYFLVVIIFSSLECLGRPCAVLLCWCRSIEFKQLNDTALIFCNAFYTNAQLDKNEVSQHPITLYLSPKPKNHSHSHIEQTHLLSKPNFKEEWASTHMLAYSHATKYWKLYNFKDEWQRDDGDGALHDRFEFRHSFASLGQILSLNHFYDPMFQKKSVHAGDDGVAIGLSICQLDLRKIVRFWA